MSERIPTVGDIMLALEAVGYTDAEASEGVARIKRRGVAIGHEMARETTQASIGDAMRKLQAIAWDEGAEHAWQSSGEGWNGEYPARGHEEGRGFITANGDKNPYREDKSDE